MLTRIIIDFLLLLLPIVFGWWLFPVIAVIFVFITKNPVEALIVGIILDSVYYFGSNFLLGNWILVFVILLYIIDYILSDIVVWKKLL